MQDAGRGREIERARELRDDGENVGDGRRPVLSQRAVERLGGHVRLREPGDAVFYAGANRRCDRRMRESAPGEHLERVRQLPCAFGREIEAERLDGDEPAFDRVVSTEDETRRAGAHLMQDTKRAECGGA